ncbi:hypothetical protein BKA67DRAFT_541903 [Truncatella angustata]|uniref:Uncharacterized protein n=1 Tax=Truncatella angustata TaxID=152316 RepID=A0A9P8RKB6_9PEZI|nr:uncharacterized protein BKA67DRAFT_541903 [Truncatella angustata]KAH6644905.1 hypothetical protein BKA67DRAFT_541903 [Truncatella angustata]KAH8193565.1 hypothetical protein TruAng_012270 [Truncatella angustata]
MDEAFSIEELRAPFQDVVSFAFETEKIYDNEQPLYINADDPHQFLSYNLTRRYVRQMVAGLKAIGLRDGDTILVHLFNNYKYAPLFLAIVGAGGVFCATNPSLRSEMTNIVHLAQPRFIITTSDLLASLQNWIPNIELDRIILFDSQQPGELRGRATRAEIGSLKPICSLLCHGERDWKRIRDEEQAKKTPASYFLTSGTTGCPKLALLSHYSMVAHFSQIHQEVPYDVVRLACLPLFHIFGSAWALALTIRHGEPLYVMPKFDMGKYLEYVSEYNITESFLAPPVVARIKQLDSSLTRSRLASLRFVGVGGAPITAGHMHEFKSMLHDDATLSGVYGATELGTACMFRYGENDESGAVGRPLPGVKVDIRRVVPDDGCPRTLVERPIAEGEVVVSAASHMMGYKNSAESPHTDVEWYRTGDLGYMRDGKLYISGRAKEIMKVNGFQVSPTEIEATLLRHPDISDCAVTKVVRDRAEMPRAYVVRRMRTVSAAEVIEFSRRQLVSYKALTGGVVFIAKIPRLPSGKIQRHKLGEMPLESDLDRGVLGAWHPWVSIMNTFERFLDQALKTSASRWMAKLFDHGSNVRKKAYKATA